MAAAAGEGFDWRSLVSGLSSLAQVYQTNKASRNAQADLEAGQQQQLQKQYQADKLVGDTVSSIAKTGPTAPQEQSLAAYTNALQRTRAAPATSMAAVGGDRYKAGVTNAASSVANYGGRQALDLSMIDAAARQRESEGVARADLGSRLHTLEDAGDTDLYLAKLRAAREQANPWVNLLAQLGKRIGSGYITKRERLYGAGVDKSGVGELSDYMPQADVRVV